MPSFAQEAYHLLLEDSLKHQEIRVRLDDPDFLQDLVHQMILEHQEDLDYHDRLTDQEVLDYHDRLTDQVGLVPHGGPDGPA